MRVVRRVLFIAAIVLISGLASGCVIARKWADVEAGSLGGYDADSRGERSVYHFYLPSKVKSLDTTKSGDLYSNTVMSEIYQGLMQYSYLKRPYQVEPCLAQREPFVSDDGLVYRFLIRDDVYFHDSPCFPEGKGRRLVAEDFVFSWKRLAWEQTAEGWWIFDDRIKGLNAFRDTWTGRKFEDVDWDEPVEGLKVIDDHTLEIHLIRPFPQLLYVLAMSYSAANAREEFDYYGDEAVNNAVGTGPYMLREWTRGTRIVLQRNPNYWTEAYPRPDPTASEEDIRAGLYRDSGRRMPFIDEVVFDIILEDSPMWLKFENGELDRSAIPKDNFESAIGPGQTLKPDLAAKEVRLEVLPLLDITYTAMNMEDPILGRNKKLRQAISLAKNTDLEIEKLRNGRGISAQGPIPPGMGGYDPDFSNPFKPRDVERARRLMAEAGYPFRPGRTSLELDYEASGTDTTSRQFDEFFADSLKDIGIKLNIVSNTWPAFVEKVKSKQAQIYGIAWSADYPDAENFLQLFYGPNQSPGPNGANYQNPEFDRLYEEATIMQPGPERDKLYAEMARMVVEDCPWVFGVHRQQFVLSQSWLKNFKYNVMRHGFVKYLRVDMAERREKRARLFSNPVKD